MERKPFSVTMCVYGKDNADWFARALESVCVQQTVKPDELVLVVDGPVPDTIEQVISRYTEICKENEIVFQVVRFEENQGQGNARRAGVSAASHELIALMDADDVSLPDRFEKQLALFDDERVCCAGGNISEFIGEESNIVSYRNVPQTDAEIKEYAKSRCPMNQVTVMFKKTAYNEAGGYIDWFWEEDYYLWLRMMRKDMVFANSEAVFVNVRVGEDMYRRRGGMKYYKSEKRVQKFMLDNRMIGRRQYYVNCAKRWIVQVAMPNSVREWAFKKFARN